MECGAEGEDGCDEVDDLFVGAEEAGEVGTEGGEEEDVEETDDGCAGERYFCAGAGGVDEG